MDPMDPLDPLDAMDLLDAMDERDKPGVDKLGAVATPDTFDERVERDPPTDSDASLEENLRIVDSPKEAGSRLKPPGHTAIFESNPTGAAACRTVWLGESVSPPPLLTRTDVGPLRRLPAKSVSRSVPEPAPKP